MIEKRPVSIDAARSMVQMWLKRADAATTRKQRAAYKECARELENEYRGYNATKEDGCK